jgi:hypothetical protein
LNTNQRKRGNQKAQARHGRRGPSRPNTRANWQRQLDHYLLRARAASEAGDRIEAENFYQHAEHYFRLIKGTAA